MLRLIRKIYLSLFPNSRLPKVKDNYFGTPVFAGAEGQELITNIIRTGKPALVARFGSAELRAMLSFLEIKKYHDSSGLDKYKQFICGNFTEWTEEVKLGLGRNAGFFPLEENYLDKFSETYNDSIKNIDILGVWGLEKEDVIYREYLSSAKLIKLNCIEPYYFNEPWSQYLENKKVLVIHPFAKTIEMQYHHHREKLFSNKKVLPSFELFTVKAVVSNAFAETDFSSWFDALEFMKNEILKKDFDIALIGAGAYGLPLAAFVKSLDKQAIHMGGSLQILFGIKGARWDNTQIAGMYNEYWVRPLPEETPEKFKSVEDGCYW